MAFVREANAQTNNAGTTQASGRVFGGGSRRMSRNNVRTNAAGEELPEAEFWLNIGLEVEDEEGNPAFESLPYGIALDTMSDSVLTDANSPLQREAGATQNWLRDTLTAELREKLMAGETVILNLQVQARRVGEKTPIDPNKSSRIQRLQKRWDSQ